MGPFSDSWTHSNATYCNHFQADWHMQGQHGDSLFTLLISLEFLKDILTWKHNNRQESLMCLPSLWHSPCWDLAPSQTLPAEITGICMPPPSEAFYESLLREIHPILNPHGVLQISILCHSLHLPYRHCVYVCVFSPIKLHFPKCLGPCGFISLTHESAINKWTN